MIISVRFISSYKAQQQPKRKIKQFITYIINLYSRYDLGIQLTFVLEIMPDTGGKN